MAQLVKVHIELEGGKKIGICRSLTIRQDIFRHHQFEVVVPFESLEEKGEVFLKNSYKEVCGKSVTFSFEPVLKNGNFRFNFKGIVTEITLSNLDDLSNVFVIKGYSPTILLEDAAVRRTFAGKNLKQVFETILGAYPGNIMKKKLRPGHSAAIRYLVQYDETNFEFLSRIASAYGEWFFYNGVEILLGAPDGEAEIDFEINGVQRFDMSISLAPARFVLSGYDYINDRRYESKSADQRVEGLTLQGKFALDESENLFTQDSLLIAGQPVYSQEELDKLASFRRSAMAGKLILFHGRGENPEIMVGTVINVSVAHPVKGGKPKKESLGTYRVIEITHEIDRSGGYSHVFRAVPERMKYPPVNTWIRQPMGQPELATIVNINDPDKMNRVKVDFHWPGADKQSDWIRVGTFYSGGGQGGMQFLPEKGSQVVVGYELNRPEQPFIITSLYPKKEGMHKMKGNNDEKLIYTKAGNLIELIDKKDENSIRITNMNKEDTSLLLEFKEDGKISVRTKGKVEISADDSISLSAQKSITLSAKKSISLEAPKIEIKADNGVNVSGADVEIKASIGAKLSGQNTEIKGDAMTSISGALVKIN